MQTPEIAAGGGEGAGSIGASRDGGEAAEKGGEKMRDGLRQFPDIDNVIGSIYGGGAGRGRDAFGGRVVDRKRGKMTKKECESFVHEVRLMKNILKAIWQFCAFLFVLRKADRWP